MPYEPDCVIVPSLHRADLLTRRTVQLLVRCAVPPSMVQVWLSDEADWAEYDGALHRAGYPAQLHVGAPGLAANRLAAMRANPPGARLLWLDDDLSDLMTLGPDGRTLVPTNGLLGAATRGFRLCAEVRARLWGISPVANAFYMKREARAGLLFAVGYLYGAVNDQGSITATQLCEKEDYERTLRCWRADGAVVRLADMAAICPVYRGGGGMVENPHRMAAQRNAVRYLAAGWPAYVHENPRRRSGYPEITLRGPRSVVLERAAA